MFISSINVPFSFSARRQKVSAKAAIAAKFGLPVYKLVSFQIKKNKYFMGCTLFCSSLLELKTSGLCML